MDRLRLSSKQIAAPLADDRVFAERYVDGLMKTHLPQYYWSISSEGRIEMVMNGRRYARYFRIEDVPSQMHFITLMWTVGANFFTFPGFAEVASSGLDGPAKIDAFYAVERDRAVAALMQPDDRYWYPEMVGLQDQLA